MFLRLENGSSVCSDAQGVVADVSSLDPACWNSRDPACWNSRDLILSLKCREEAFDWKFLWTPSDTNKVAGTTTKLNLSSSPFSFDDFRFLLSLPLF